VIKNGKVFTIDELIGPFASSPGAHAGKGAHAPLSSASHPSPFWWHDLEYVESSRAACCADHFLAPGLRGRSFV
jgi:hypothetical protein